MPVKNFLKDYVLPRSNQQAFTSSFYVFLILCGVYVQLTVTIPDIFEYGSSFYYVFVMCLLYASSATIFNLIMMVYTDPSLAKMMLVQRAKPDWDYCLRCESVRPPRAHHCRKCDVCVLRFDHHCTYLVQCVGHANVTYFIRLLPYLSLTCFIAVLFSFPYVWRHIYTDWPTVWCVVCYLNPIPFALIGWLSLGQTALCMLTSLSGVLSLAMAAFFVYHFRLIMLNQTSVEVIIRQSRNPSQVIGYENSDSQPINYDLGSWRANLRQVLGRNWLIGFFLPWTFADSTTSGLEFPVVRA